MAERFQSSEEMVRRAREAARSRRDPSSEPHAADPSSEPAAAEPADGPTPQAPTPPGHAPRVEHLEVEPLVTAPPPSPPSAPSAAAPPGRALVAFVVALLLLGSGLVATQLIDVEGTDETPTTSPITADPQPGTCLRDPGGGFAALEPVDCEQPHDLEVFAIVDLAYGPDDPIPEDDELFDAAFQGCLDRFSTYTNEAWEDSPYYIRTYVPDRRGWRAGDRSVVCTLYAADADGRPVPSTGTATGTDA